MLLGCPAESRIAISRRSRSCRSRSVISRIAISRRSRTCRSKEREAVRVTSPDGASRLSEWSTAYTGMAQRGEVIII